jgi:DNA invertase Pin-like site-specific DNA recombinase
MVNKAVLYFRYSPRPTDDDALRKQAEDTVSWCERNDIEPRAFYFDAGKSGAAALQRRPGMRAALKELRKGDLFVVRDLKRVARDLTIALWIESAIELKRARLCSIEDGGIQPTKREDLMGWAFRILVYLMGDVERINNQQRCVRRARDRQRNGIAAGGSAPFGYMFIEGGMDPRTGTRITKLVRDPTEHYMLQEIVKLHLEGFDITEVTDFIAHKFDGKARGKGGRWHRNTIKRMLNRYDRGDFPDEVLA